MDYDRYVQLVQQAAQLVEAGEHDQALTIFRPLLSEDISDLDKALMCYNMAIVYEKKGSEQEALSHLDRGVSYERPHSRIFVAEHRAGYLSRVGRNQESLRAYEELLSRSCVTEEEKFRITSNIALLRDMIQ